MPLPCRTGLHIHLNGVAAPSAAENIESGVVESLGKPVRLSAFGSIACEPFDELIVREDLCPLLEVFCHFTFVAEFRVAEARIGAVREHYVEIPHHKALHCVLVGLREIAPESV